MESHKVPKEIIPPFSHESFKAITSTPKQPIFSSHQHNPAKSQLIETQNRGIIKPYNNPNQPSITETGERKKSSSKIHQKPIQEPATEPPKSNPGIQSINQLQPKENTQSTLQNSQHQQPQICCKNHPKRTPVGFAGTGPENTA
jgi:hypothetical protein